jgi:hypothetical protein
LASRSSTATIADVQPDRLHATGRHARIVPATAKLAGQAGIQQKTSVALGKTHTGVLRLDIAEHHRESFRHEFDA